MRLHRVCEKHNITVLVGRDTLISEIECTRCIEEIDGLSAFRPCCPQMNTTCCGHDDDYPDPYPVLATIDSPNYCDRVHASADVPF